MLFFPVRTLITKKYWPKFYSWRGLCHQTQKFSAHTIWSIYIPIWTSTIYHLCCNNKFLNDFMFSLCVSFKTGMSRVNCLPTRVNIIHSTSYQTQRIVRMPFQKSSCIETSPHRTCYNRIVMYYKSSRNEFYDMYFRTNFSIKRNYILEWLELNCSNSCCVVPYRVVTC